MKKLSTFLLLVLGGSIEALPVGNPAEATLFCTQNRENRTLWDCFQFDVGFYGDYVYNRHMETVNGKDINTTQLFTNAGYLALNVWDRGEIFAALGVSSLSFNTSLGAFNAIDPHPLFELISGSSFSYTAGAKATLARYRCAYLGISGQYFAVSPNAKRLYIASGAVSYPGDTLCTRYSEWQLAAGITYHYNDFFAPYVAVQYAQSYWKLNNGHLFVIEDNTGTLLYNLKNQRHCAYTVGLTLCPPACNQLAVSVEGRFAAEKALHIQAQMRF